MHRRDYILRDYILIAKTLKEAKKNSDGTEFEKDVINRIISRFCSALKAENSSFNEQKFRDYIQKGE